MSINKNSIFLKLNALFLIAIISISVIFLVFLKIGERRQIGIIINDSRHVIRIVRTIGTADSTKLNSILKDEGYEVISDKKTILQMAEPIKYPKNLPKFQQKRLLGKKIQILKYDGNIYFNFPRHKLLVQNRTYSKRYIWILFAYLSIAGILLGIYLTLRGALKPIQKLEVEIKKFGQGELDIDTKSEKKDEIATVSNEFDKAVQKIKALQNSRALFLRNMMHELKTPITKGKLSLSLIEDSSEHHMLEKVFHKLESLINEMVEIERISTQNIKIDKKEHRLIDIVDEATKLLYLDPKQVVHHIHNQSVVCDFKLFTLAIKNLMDNAIKYSVDNTVHIEANHSSIKIINKAPKLQAPLEQYIEPFYKGELSSANQKGFGLGLYIVNEIVKKCGFYLRYEHVKEENIFQIYII